MKKAVARFGGTGRIVVDDCPYCHRTHYHNLPVGGGQRAADCFQGKYILLFEDAPNNGFCQCDTGYPIATHPVCGICGLPRR